MSKHVIAAQSGFRALYLDDDYDPYFLPVVAWLISLDNDGEPDNVTSCALVMLADGSVCAADDTIAGPHFGRILGPTDNRFKTEEAIDDLQAERKSRA